MIQLVAHIEIMILWNTSCPLLFMREIKAVLIIYNISQTSNYNTSETELVLRCHFSESYVCVVFSFTIAQNHY